MSTVETRPPGPAIRVPELCSGVKLIGLQRDDFLFRGSRVVVESPTAMDTEAAQRSKLTAVSRSTLRTRAPPEFSVSRAATEDECPSS